MGIRPSPCSGDRRQSQFSMFTHHVPFGAMVVNKILMTQAQSRQNTKVVVWKQLSRDLIGLIGIMGKLLPLTSTFIKRRLPKLLYHPI